MERPEPPTPRVEFRREWIDRKTMVDPLRPHLKGKTIDCRYDPRQDRYERWYTVPTNEPDLYRNIYDANGYMMGTGTYTTGPSPYAGAMTITTTSGSTGGWAQMSHPVTITNMGVGTTLDLYSLTDETQWEMELMADGFMPIVTAEGEKTPEYSMDGRKL